MGNLMELNEIIFRELDRLESAEGDELEAEISRAKEVGALAGKVNDVSRTIIQAAQVGAAAAEQVRIPRQLLGSDAPTVGEMQAALENG